MTPLEQARDALTRAGVPGAVKSARHVPPIVSPMCRGADWTCLVVETDDDALFLKLQEADAAGFVSAADAALAAGAAAALGVAPAVRFTQSHVIGFDLLPSPWREARLGDLDPSAVLEAVLRAKRALHDAPVQLRDWDVFEQIARQASRVPAPPLDLLAAVADIQAALRAAGQDRRFGHCDGVISNMMLHPDGAVRLVDFDCAGMADPFYDIGIFLNEVCEQPRDWHAGLEMAFGRSSSEVASRCQAYGIADDLLWGLWGLAQQAASPRTGLEYLKYGMWRLLRCRMAVQRTEHDNLLRDL
jgi:hypothetical protein